MMLETLLVESIFFFSFNDLYYNIIRKTNKVTSSAIIPYTKYTIRVRARNKIGVSIESRKDDNSNSVLTTLPARPQQNPEVLKLAGSRPAELLVTWKAVPSKFYNGPDFQYVFEYCLNQDLTLSCGECPNWVQVELASPSTEYVIKDSKEPYQDWLSNFILNNLKKYRC